MWDNVRAKTPIAMWQELSNMCPLAKTIFIMTGFKCKYTQEWDETYQSVLNYVDCVTQLYNCQDQL